MQKITDILNPFSPAICLSCPISKAADLFDSTGLSTLPVLKNGKFAGILEIWNLPVDYPTSRQQVADFFSKDTVFLTPDDPADAAADLLAGGFLELVPVVDAAGELAGIVTAAEVAGAFGLPELVARDFSAF